MPKKKTATTSIRAKLKATEKRLAAKGAFKTDAEIEWQGKLIDFDSFDWSEFWVSESQSGGKIFSGETATDFREWLSGNTDEKKKLKKLLKA